VQRHAALAIPFHAGDLGAAEPARAVDPEALGANRIADCTARFIARRNATRRSNCWAIPSAISFASISGFLISRMLRLTSLLVTLAMSPRNLSMSAPFLPMMTPGRAVWIVTRAFLAGRSITMRDTPAWVRRSLRYLRSCRSWCSSRA